MANVLDRDVFHVLTLLSLDRLERINPDTARKKNGFACPLSQAAGGACVDSMIPVSVLGLVDGPEARWAVRRFINGWDEGEFTRPTLWKALGNAIGLARAAHGGDADARP